MANEDSIWSKIAPQVEILIPGTWAGALAVGLLAWVKPVATKQWIDTLGSVLVLPVVAFVGVVLYLVYRVAIGEWLLYPARHLLLAGADWVWRKAKGRGFLSFTRLLAYRNVPFFFRRYTYSAIRDAENGSFSAPQRQQFDFLHATYHLFYVTALEFLGLSVIPSGLDAATVHTLRLLGFGFLAIALLADIRQDIWECRLMQARGTNVGDVIAEILGNVGPRAV